MSQHNRDRPFVSRAVRAAAGCLLGVLLAGSAGADTLWLTNGRSLEGTAVVRDDGDVELHSTMGVVRFPGHKVDRIERSESIEDQVASRLDALQSVSVDDLYELGMEARLDGAYTLSERLLNEALRLDPDHEPSRTALGFVRTPDGWMLERLLPAARDRGSARPLDAEAAERIALLRSLRAQAEASRLAELQRRQLLALEAQRLAETQRRAMRPAVADDFVVHTVVPIWTGAVPVGRLPTVQERGARSGRATQQGAVQRRGSGTAPPTSQSPDRARRRNTIVRGSGSSN